MLSLCFSRISKQSLIIYFGSSMRSRSFQFQRFPVVAAFARRKFLLRWRIKVRALIFLRMLGMATVVKGLVVGVTTIVTTAGGTLVRMVVGMTTVVTAGTALVRLVVGITRITTSLLMPTHIKTIPAVQSKMRSRYRLRPPVPVAIAIPGAVAVTFPCRSRFASVPMLSVLCGESPVL